MNKQPEKARSDTMRILFCTHDMDSGGSGRSLSILIRQLAPRHDISVLSLIPPNPAKGIGKLYEGLGVHVYVIPWGWLPVSYVACRVDAATQKSRCAQLRPYVPQIKELGKKFDAICFNGYPSSSLAALFPSAIPKFLIAREVVDSSSPELSTVAAFLRKHIRHAFAIGRVEGEQLAKWEIPHTIVYNSSPATPRFRELPPSPPILFGAFGQLIPGKGFDVLAQACLQAAPALRSSQSSVHIFGGTGNPALSPLENPIQDFIARNKLHDVLYMEGWTNSVEDSMADMHCIIRPDETGHPWGRDIIEAMSIGRPVLATGTEDLFIHEAENGWLVPPGNAQALAKAITALTRSAPLLGRMAKNAFAFAQEHFDPECNAKKIEAVITADTGTIAGPCAE